MHHTFHKYLDPLMAMNRRILIGGGVLALIVISESAMSFIKPYA